MRRLLVGCAVAGLLLAAGGPAAAARRETLDFRRVELDLPGPPAKVIPADLDGDGRTDLVVALAYTEIESIGGFRVENAIQIATVIPALLDRREIRAYLAQAGGGYRPAGEPMPMPSSILAMETGPPGVGVVALTDDGVAQLRLTGAASGPSLELVPLIAEPPVLAGTQTFLAQLEVVSDLDGDGVADLLLPIRDSLAVHLGDGMGLSAQAADHVPVPEGERVIRSRVVRDYPLPKVIHFNGDTLPDLLFESDYRTRSRGTFHVLLGAGGGRFRPLRETKLDCFDDGTDVRMVVASPGDRPWPGNLIAIRDLDGDRRAEAVFADERDRGDSLRKELKDAKQPIHDYRLHRIREDGAIEREPYAAFQAVGHSFDSDDIDDEDLLPFRVEQFQDLDGDGREELVTITLDFSIFQVLRILSTKTVRLGLDFHVYAQEPDGGFAEVPDLDLSERLRIDLNNLTLGRLAHFAGDFDGDGRQDFVHLGRGKEVTLHLGRPGSRFPSDPDARILLEEEADSLDLVRVEDLDGDGRADLRITRPTPIDDPDLTAPVRLELYLSGGGS